MYTNEDRAKTAENAVNFFAEETGIQEEDIKTKVQDLLVNLRHLCDKTGLDYYECADASYLTYLHEVKSEEPATTPV